MLVLYHQSKCLDNIKAWAYDRRMKLIFGLVLAILLLLTPINSYAQETTVTPTSAPSAQTSSYTLPYPGILPDSPFYKLKLMRDKLILMFTTDPARKIEFYILQADKQTAMIPILMTQNKKNLAAKIALRAEDNITQITFVYKSKNDKPTKDFYKKLEASIQKHQEIYFKAVEATTGKDQEIFKQAINFSKTNWEELQRIYSDSASNSAIYK